MNFAFQCPDPLVEQVVGTLLRAPEAERPLHLRVARVLREDAHPAGHSAPCAGAPAPPLRPNSPQTARPSGPPGVLPGRTNLHQPTTALPLEPRSVRKLSQTKIQEARQRRLDVAEAERSRRHAARAATNNAPTGQDGVLIGCFVPKRVSKEGLLPERASWEGRFVKEASGGGRLNERPSRRGPFKIQPSERGPSSGQASLAGRLADRPQGKGFAANGLSCEGSRILPVHLLRCRLPPNICRVMLGLRGMTRQ